MKRVTTASQSDLTTPKPVTASGRTPGGRPPVPSAREIADRVPMPRLLYHLGFKVNERARRAPCVLHCGDNRTAFSWTEEGFWHCFACGRGGDKYGLIRAALRCSFPEAVRLMASLAGIPLDWNAGSVRTLARQNRKRARLEGAAEQYQDLERACRLAYRGQLLALVQGQTAVSRRLAAIGRGCVQASPREEEIWWETLVHVDGQERRVRAAYHLLAFGAEDLRQRFVLYESQREPLCGQVLDDGGVVDDDGRFVEMVA